MAGIQEGLKTVDKAAGHARLRNLKIESAARRRGRAMGIKDIDPLIIGVLDDRRRATLENGGKMIVDCTGWVSYQDRPVDQ